MTIRLSKLFDGRKTRKAATLSLAAIIGLSMLNLPVLAAPSDLSQENLILVMPNATANSDDIKEAFEDVNGTVIGAIGKGKLQVLIVKAEAGQELQTETKLLKDKKNFAAVNMNHRIAGDYVPGDPTVPKAWHLRKMNVMGAWDLLSGAFGHVGRTGTVAVLDSGCSWNGDTETVSWGADVTGINRAIGTKLKKATANTAVQDLGKEMKEWSDTAKDNSSGNQDTNGHGTWVAATIAGRENGLNSVGINPAANIYPIKIADGKFNTKIYTDDMKLVAGMTVAMSTGCRIVNISYGGLNDSTKHAVLHELFKHFYYDKNGLVFNSAGNDGEVLTHSDSIYLNTVSALRQTRLGRNTPSLKLVNKEDDGWGSNYGNCVDFAAPGIDIPVSNPDGTAASVGGTSFATPIVAGIASLVMHANPRLSSASVRSILIASCSGNGRSQKFGYGMPDAKKAVELARSGRY